MLSHRQLSFNEMRQRLRCVSDSVQADVSSSVYLPISGAAGEPADSFVRGSEGFKRSRSRCGGNPGSCVTRIKTRPRLSFCPPKTGVTMKTTCGIKVLQLQHRLDLKTHLIMTIKFTLLAHI